MAMCVAMTASMLVNVCTTICDCLQQDQRQYRQVPYLLQVVGLDFAQEMLDDAARRDTQLPAYWDRAPIEWVQGDALQLPFDDASFDAATMGYGLRWAANSCSI